jgi:hypothetical protein
MRRWLPLSTAAVILLGVSLTLNLMPPPDLSVTPEASLERSPAPASSPVRSFEPLQEKAQEAPASAASSADGRLFDMPEPLEMEEAPPAEKAYTERAVVQPEAQVAEMIELLRQGDTQALTAALRQFRSAHPDYPLPQELSRFEAAAP